MDFTSREQAQKLDAEDPLNNLRSQFLIPTKADLARPFLNPQASETAEQNQPCIYLCGNSLGVQPKRTRNYFEQYLSKWAQKGVYGHFKEVQDTDLPPWMNVDENLQDDMAAIVGAQSSEVAIMQTLTANLHLMMASFYRPTKDRYKIILEGKAFPSDHYAIESQIAHHNLSPSDAMIMIEPPNPTQPYLPTSHILATIDAHASTTALLLLPGIQFYTGQLLDIPTITSHAHAAGITVGWDLAHAAGNVPLSLHDWNADFAVWCTYKYLNSGPGSIGGAFVHSRHTRITSHTTTPTDEPTYTYRPRLSGWWGSSKTSRFAMTNRFQPMPGAAGFQLSNTSVADGTAVRASLDVFKQTSMSAIRAKSLKLTGYLERMLEALAARQDAALQGGCCFEIITPRAEGERGAQLSVRLTPGLLDTVMEVLEREGVVLDERKPDVIRVAPAPLYNSYTDVFDFIEIFGRACEGAVQRREGGGSVSEGG